ncbi:Peptidase S8/S53, subtilisin/kexin/sedolisin [Metarhizium brunneum]
MNEVKLCDEELLQMRGDLISSMKNPEAFIERVFSCRIRLPLLVEQADLPHADASILEALYGFNVKMWDWKRVDLCSDIMYESSPVIKEVSVYSSGNNAVLTGWASEDGLGNREKFPWLEKINLFVQDVSPSTRTRRNSDDFTDPPFDTSKRASKMTRDGSRTTDISRRRLQNMG